MLHIHNGDCSANIAKESSLPGEHFAWRESLITGPTPAGVSGSDWRSVRAQYLSEAYGVDLEECERGLLDQEKKLSSAEEHEEVVLWFEHDLFCQTNLLYLLNWFAQQETGNAKLSLICIGEFPGKENFRGLGELDAEQMASLFPGRQQVTSPQLKLAELTWQAYCSPDPAEIEKVLQTGTSLLPFLRQALQAHLRRFPSTKNGLGRIENKGLELIQGGSETFIDVFPRFGDAEPIYGLGDAQFWLALQGMSGGKQPLLRIENGKNGGRELTPDIVRKAKFEITEPGKAVLRGEADFVELNGIDLWLGGVHLSRSNLWRWDESSETIVSD
ncbi:MAG: RNA polymerase subunit sigma-24 [Acidobacteriota bacterium]|nr:RNA polymerase subunit sigma-24 [Acidobacteriota bacterium]